MVTQKGANTKVIGITGNFDDAQTGVKKMFNDAELKAELKEKGFCFSSANSINIGRLFPQVAYYVYAYSKLLAMGKITDGQEITAVVPTGNFGNILACYYAKKLGVPFGKFVCASNENRVLYDFFKTGTYDRRRDFVLTNSPSMDILISSNLERLIYHIAGDDAKKNADLMKELSENGIYTITDEMKANLEGFFGGFATQEETLNRIHNLYEKTGYVLDTHTGVASAVYEKYVAETGDKNPAVIVSTASPYKFARAVMSAVKSEEQTGDDFAIIDELITASKVAEPKAITEIRTAPVLHDTVCETEDMKNQVKAFLGL